MIGSNFSTELEAAGLLGLPFAWNAEGDITFGDTMTPEQVAAVQTVYAAHNATAASPNDVDAARDAVLSRGYVDATTGKTYQTDERSIGYLTPIGSAAGLAVVMGTSPAPTFDIITLDNTTITLSAAEAFALLQGRVMPWVSATMLYARTLKNEIEAGGKPDVTAGWP